MFPQLAGDVLERGLARACLPGRFEIVAPVAGYEGIPALVLDGAHTVRSVALTMESFDRLFGGDGWGPGDRPGRVRGGRAKPVLLFACAADKDVEDISNLFTGHFSAVFLTRPGAAKAADLARLSAAFTAAGLDFQLDGNCRTAIAASLQEAARCQVPLLVTGSFYLVAAVKDVLAVTGRQPSSSWPL